MLTIETTESDSQYRVDMQALAAAVLAGVPGCTAVTVADRTEDGAPLYDQLRVEVTGRPPGFPLPWEAEIVVTREMLWDEALRGYLIATLRYHAARFEQEARA